MDVLSIEEKEYLEMKKRIVIICWIITTVLAAASGAYLSIRCIRELIAKSENARGKSNELVRLYALWMDKISEGRTIRSFFDHNDYHSAAVYGMGKLGISLTKQLKQEHVVVDYGIDRRAEDIGEEMKIISPDEELPSTDVIIVAVVSDFDDIREMLQKKTEIPVISIETVLNGI